MTSRYSSSRSPDTAPRFTGARNIRTPHSAHLGGTALDVLKAVDSFIGVTFLRGHQDVRPAGWRGKETLRPAGRSRTTYAGCFGAKPRWSYASFQRPLEAPPQRVDGRIRVVERASPRRLQAVVASRTAGADFRACTELRGHQLFAFEAIERCVDGAGTNLPSDPPLHFFQDGPPVRVAAPPYDRPH